MCVALKLMVESCEFAFSFLANSKINNVERTADCESKKSTDKNLGNCLFFLFSKLSKVDF